MKSIVLLTAASVAVYSAVAALQPMPKGELPDPAGLAINVGHKIAFAHPLPRMRCGRTQCGTYNNWELAFPGLLTTAGADFGNALWDLRKVVWADRRLVFVDGRTLVCQLNWIRDHIHQMKGYRHWEHDLTSFLDFILDTQRADGQFYELIKQLDDFHWTFVPPDCRILYPEDNQSLVRLELEADIEYLMVEGCLQAWRVTGDDDWLRRALPRLEKGIDYMTSDAKRWDKAHGLCMRPYTIDTWDFTNDPLSGSNRSVILSEPMAVMHGDNSGVYQAMNQLAWINERFGNAAKASEWRERAATLKANMFKHLWNGTFFCHQLPLNCEPLDAHEKNRLSLSMAYALNRGLLTLEQKCGVVAEYKTRRSTTKGFSEWFTIDPAYCPTFKGNPPGRYVNGALSPFTAGELARGAFECGEEAYGWDILNRVAKMVKRDDGKLYFLYDPISGKPQGGGPSAWGAAAILAAVDEGLAGVQDLDAQYRAIRFAPRWAVTPFDEGRYLTGYEASHKTVDVRWIFTDKGFRYHLRSPANKVSAHLLVPSGKMPDSLYVNGEQVPFSLVTVGDSRYVDADVTPQAGIADFEVLYVEEAWFGARIPTSGEDGREDCGMTAARIFDAPIAGLTRIGTLAVPKSADLPESSSASIGFECLDRGLFDPDRCYDTLAAAGVKWARCQTMWSRCEKQKGIYDFTVLDGVVDNLTRRGIRPWFCVTFGNTLYMTNCFTGAAVGCVPTLYGDECRAAWCAYVRALAKRYKGKVTHWEIWNEPNIKHFWQPSQPNAAEYLELVKLTGGIIREEIPDAKIGGTTCSPALNKWETEFFELGGAAAIDFWCSHAYARVPERLRKQQRIASGSSADYVTVLKDVRAFIDAHGGKHVEIWQGESGFPSWFPAGHWLWWPKSVCKEGWQSQANQAKWLLRRFVTDRRAGIARSSFFQMADISRHYSMALTTQTHPAEHGIVNGWTYRPKMSCHAFGHYNALLATARYDDSVAVSVTPASDAGAPTVATTFRAANGAPLFLYYTAFDFSGAYTGTCYTVRCDAKLTVPTALAPKEPVLVDMLRGGVYAVSSHAETDGNVTYADLPLVDYPLVLCDRSAVKLVVPRGAASAVNPFIGTAGDGHCFPAAAYPFGIVAAGPDTGWGSWKYCSGYVYDDKTITMFSQTHNPGGGCPDYADIGILPGGAESPYDKAGERAEPGYYAVTLSNGSIRVEATATERCAFYRIGYGATNKAVLLVDLDYGMGNTTWAKKTVKPLKISTDRTDGISGHLFRNGFVKGRNIGFDIRFSKAPASRKELPPPLGGGVHAPKFRYTFDLSDGSPLLVKIALSTVSDEGAAKNLAAELPDWDFDRVRRAAQAKWNEILSRIQLADGTDADTRTLFYTSLYRMFHAPVNIADVDGAYRGGDDKIGRMPSGRYYSELSLWDTFRGAHPFYTIVAPEYVPDFVNSMLAHYAAVGYLPVLPKWGKDSQCMIATHAVAVIADAYFKGFKGVDWETAYQAIRNTLREKHVGRHKEDWDLLDRYGYYPCDKLKGEGVSRTLECAYDDWCAARMASALGHAEDAAFFEKRARNWRNVFDAKTGFMRGRRTDGGWREPFDPYRCGHETSWAGDFTEGNAWQWRWHVLHDPEGLIAALGGKEKAAALLEELFSLPSDLDKSHTSPDVTGLLGQYVQGNEPSHHIPYLYQYVGRPDLAASRIRQLCRLFYRNTPDGLCGNEDHGEMSAWYVFACLGFYPLNPSSGEFVIGAPQVPSATIRLSNGNTFTIVAKGLSEKNKYVKSVTLNGRKLDGFVFRYADVMKGGTLVFEMTDAPGGSRSCATAVSPTMENLLDSYVTAGRIAGVVSVLSDADYNVQFDCVGWAERWKRKMTPDTLFAIFSMTKTFTGTAIMCAIDDGKLSLDDEVSKFLPEFADVRMKDGSKPNRPLTIRHLTTHTTGWRGGTGVVNRDIPLREVARQLAARPLSFQPGETFAYGNAWICTAAACLETAVGKPYEVYLKERVLDPLGMKDTTFAPNAEQLTRLVCAYTSDDKPLRPAADHCTRQLVFPKEKPVFPAASGGLFSTPRDMIAFSQMLAHHGEWKGKTIISRKTFDSVFSVKQTPPGIVQPYTCGSWLYGDWFGHEGAMRTDQRANLRTGHSRVFFIQTENKAGSAFFQLKKDWHAAADKIQHTPPTTFGN